MRLIGHNPSMSHLISDQLEVKLACLEILNDLLRRFAGHLTETESRECLGSLFGELTSTRAQPCAAFHARRSVE